MQKICLYCEREFEEYGQACPSCANKRPLIREFVKARDDLREKCGLKRMRFARGEYEE